MEKLITEEGIQDLSSITVTNKKELFENYYLLNINEVKDGVMISKTDYTKLGIVDNEPSGPVKYQLKKNKNGELKAWIISEPKKFGGGGGGFRPSTPKTIAEQHAASICRLVIGPLEHMIAQDKMDLKAWEQITEKALEMYLLGLKKAEETFKVSS